MGERRSIYIKATFTLQDSSTLLQRSGRSDQIMEPEPDLVERTYVVICQDFVLLSFRKDGGSVE